MFKKTLNVFVISGALVATAQSQAAGKAYSSSRTTVAQAPMYNTTSSYGGGYSSGPKFSFGYERMSLPTGGVGMLHGQLGLNPQMWLGVGFGFYSNFDGVAVGPDLQYNFITKGATSLFGDVKMGFSHVSAGTGGASGFYTGLLFGFSYGLTENFRVSLGYGLEMGFGDLFDDATVGVTQGPDFAGNFGAHWYF